MSTYEAAWLAISATVVIIAATIGWHRSRSARVTVGIALLGVVAGTFVAGIATYAPVAITVALSFALVCALLGGVLRRSRAR